MQKNSTKHKRFFRKNVPSMRLAFEGVARAFIYCVYVFLAVFAAYHVFFGRRIIPGVHVGSVHVGGLSFSQAKKKVESELKPLDKTINIVYEQDVYSYSAEQLGLNYNIEASVVRAFEVGRTGNFFVDTKDKIAGFFRPLIIRAYYSIDDEEFSQVFDLVRGYVNVAPTNAQFIYEDSSVVVVPSIDGVQVDSEELYADVVLGIETFDFSEKHVKVDGVPAIPNTQQLTEVLPRVQKIVSVPLRVTYLQNSWEIKESELLSYVDVAIETLEGDNVSPANINNQTFVEVTLKLNDQAFENLVASLSSEVNILPRGQVTNVQNNRVVGFEIIEDGREVNVKQFERNFKEVFFNEAFFDSIMVSNEAPLAYREVTLAVDTISEFNDVNEYGIVALLGEGKSKFAGSAPSRITNLTLAAERTNGVLIPPGATYSFNESVGEISSRTGYATAYIISNGRTVLGDGGGVCQTSTTLFRAVLDSGLQVVTRHPHAYRVVYYEQESPVGLDASIYQPHLDFQFKNDTDHHVLVQSLYNKADSSLIFRLYGTPDGRQVEMTEPVLTNQTAPPAPSYQDDPTLPKGTVKQVDFAAWGGRASFDRTVTLNGEVLHEDTFVTNYQPWQAVYLVGTKEN